MFPSISTARPHYKRKLKQRFIRRNPSRESERLEPPSAAKPGRGADGPTRGLSRPGAAVLSPARAAPALPCWSKSLRKSAMRCSFFFWESAARCSLSRGSAPRSGSTPESLLRRRHGAFPGAMAQSRPEPCPEPPRAGLAGHTPGRAGPGDERSPRCPGSVRNGGNGVRGGGRCECPALEVPQALAHVVTGKGETGTS